MKFWDMINIGDKESCWEWKSKSGTGERAYTRHEGKAWNASRLAWHLTFGKIPAGMCVCHKCDNPPCCNPSHLFLGTIQDNVNDRERKGRNKVPMLKGEEHGIHKLTQKEVLEIRKLYETKKYSYLSLANKYNVSFSNIRKVVKGWTWGWLNG